MAYNFTLSDGTPITVADGAIDTTQFSIGLIGRNVSGYGEQVAQDMVHMLENYSSTTAPSLPTTGQLWFNTTTQIMNMYNGTGWVGLASGSISGDLILSGNLYPAADCAGPPPSDIGSPSLQFCNVYANTFHGDLNGEATQAKYADLAERFEADAEYEVGTVVKIGGDKEVTQTTEANDMDVFGVVSEKPGYLMNSSAGEDATHPKIALAGRVYVKCSGLVNKGDRLVSSAVAGQAMCADVATMTPFTVIGRALSDAVDGMVLAVVGTK